MGSPSLLGRYADPVNSKSLSNENVVMSMLFRCPTVGMMVMVPTGLETQLSELYCWAAESAGSNNISPTAMARLMWA